MLDSLPMTLERPIWLWLLVLLLPVLWMSVRSIGGGVSRVKAWVTFAFRAVLMLILITALCAPSFVQRGEGVTVTMLLDRSQSVPVPLKRSSLEFLHLASEAGRDPNDRIAVIALAKDVGIQAMPDRYSMVRINHDVADPTATNLQSGVKMAMAIMPPDTANRIVLVSDGNETEGDVLEAAREAQANKIPIDVIVLEYEHNNEVIFERLVAPTQARRGQLANIRMVLRSQHLARGTMYLTMNGEPIDLDPDAPGDGLAMELEPGTRVFQRPVLLDESGPMKFEANFVPATPADDSIMHNNSAVAVTFVGGEGRVLVVDDSGGVESQYLVQALREGAIDVVVLGTLDLGDSVFLSGFDAVILANVPRYAIDDEQDRLLHGYVHDIGGGLVMLGGPESFGAGGWNESETKRVLPVNLDPPQTRQMPRGALVLIMHSCEMPQANYWGQRVAEAAIEALSRLDYAGIVEYNWGARAPGGFGGSSWAFPLQIVGDKTAALAATKQMTVGDMPDFGSSMQLALDGLTSVTAGQKHTIIISDGDPSPPSPQLLNGYVAGRITVTTVMVGGHGTQQDRVRMQAVADATGGTFYNVTNPNQLPQIFIKEAQLVSRNLIQEGQQWAPQMASRAPGPLEGYTAFPFIEGYVLTAPREGLVQTPLVISTTEGNDPLYAYWNYGLGRSIAYTSDLTGRWGSPWVSWSDFQAFWEQSIRWVMRPGSPRNVQVNTRREGDLAIIEVEAVEDDRSFMNFLNARARVLAPNGTAETMQLQQTGPGRYRGTFRATDVGAYLVNITYPGGEGGQPANVQAAISVPYAEEFKATRHNRVLLQRLADQTGGRVLSADDPQAVALFDRYGLVMPRGLKPIWDMLVILAAILLIFDVASRRLSFNPKWVAGLVGRAVGRYQEKSEDTMEAWKRARTQINRRAAPAQQKQADERFEAQAGDQQTSFDVATDASSRKESSATTQPKRTDGTDKNAPAGTDEGEYTSRLLQAKRRARGDEGDSKDKSGSGA